MCGIGAPAEKHGGLAAGRCISLLPGARTTVAGAAVLGLAGSPERGVLDEQGGEADGASVPVPPRKILADRVQRRPRRERKSRPRRGRGQMELAPSARGLSPTPSSTPACSTPSSPAS